MSKVASLQTELQNLIAQSRRHNTELYKASESALARLNSLVKSDTLSPDKDQGCIESLAQYPDFISPFILACAAADAKSCASALQCVQNLAVYRGIAASRMHELLQALMEATQLGLSIQLKILQLLPVLLYESAADMSENDIVDLLQVCAALLSNNRVAVVHNTAYATLQQLITGVFDRIGQTSDQSKSRILVLDEDVSFNVTSDVWDAAMIFLDLCDIAEHNEPRFVHFKDLPLTFTLELLELTLTNQAAIMHQEEFASILCRRVCPLLIRLNAEISDFPILLRVTRIFYLLLRTHLDVVTTEAEVILSTLTNFAAQGPSWRRALSLEVLQGIFLELDLVSDIYSRYDAAKDKTDILKHIIDEFASSLADELPLAADRTEFTLSRNSALRVPVIDLLDKSEPPRVSPDYLLYLSVKCINSLADGLGNLANSLNDGAIIQQLAPSLLPCFAIAIGASVGLDFYRPIVRAVQRTAHAAGVWGLNTIRDDYTRLLSQSISVDEDHESSELPRASLCARALFNLGFALGNQLGGSWSLITDTINRLDSQINFSNPSLENLLGNEEKYAPIEHGLRKLLDQSPQLSDDAVAELLRALGTDRMIDFVLQEYLVSVDPGRFSDPDTGLWQTLSEVFLSQLNGDKASEAAKTLNRASMMAIAAVEVPEGYAMIVDSICKEIECTSDGIQAEALAHLYVLLDQYGARLQGAGWAEMFSVFAYCSENANNPTLVKNAFRAVELVCTDFLENLPYPRVFELTLCLDRFSRQQSDLNTSLAATSLFWPVCDHLMREKCDSDVPDVHSESELVAAARSGPAKRPALWLLAQIKLAQIAASIPQHQARIGAIHIFFRLFASHGNKLPLNAWNVAHRLTFSALLAIDPGKDGIAERDETLGLLIEGLGQIWKEHMKVFRSLSGFDKHWKALLDYFNNVACITPAAATLCYRTLGDLLQLADGQAVSGAWDFWTKQQTRPNFSNRRATAEALTALVGLYVPLSRLKKPSASEQDEALKFIADCGYFPVKGALQEEIENVLPLFSGPTYLATLAKFAVLPLDDEEGEQFEEIGNWALHQLLELQTAEIGGSEEAAFLLQSSLRVMQAGDRSSATDLYLRLLSETPSNLRGKFVVKGVETLLVGPSESTQLKDIEALDAVLNLSLDLSPSEWQSVIRNIAGFSLIYERGRPGFDELNFDDELVLRFGSVKVPRPLPRQKVAYHCLGLLPSLSAEDFEKRARGALLQFIGDSKLRSKEPLRKIMRDELIYILQRLLEPPPGLRELLIECVSTHDRDIQNLAREKLLS